MLRPLRLAALFSACLVGLLHCSTTAEPIAGSEGGACLPGGLCSGALSCVGDVCAGEDADAGAEPDAGAAEPRLRLLDWQQSGSNIMAFVSLTDRRTGRGIPDAASRLHVVEDGAALSVESGLAISARPRDYSWRTALLFDTSESVLSAGGLPTMAEALKTFAARVTAQNSDSRRVGLAAFDGADRLRALLPEDSWTPDRMTFMHFPGQPEVVLEAFKGAECGSSADCTLDTARPRCVSGLCVDPSTNIYGSVVQAAQQLREALDQDGLGQPRGSAIVLLTDGRDQAGRATLAQALRAADDARAHVFTLGVSGEVDADALRQLGRDGAFLVSDLASTQRGLDQVWTALQGIGEGIYLVSYCTPKRSGEHRLRVSADGATETVEVPFSATDDATCDPSAAAQACVGRQCGNASNGFWCGDCGGRQQCDDGVCKAGWAASTKSAPWSVYASRLIGALGKLWVATGDGALWRSDEGVRWVRVASSVPFGGADGATFLERGGRLYVHKGRSVYSTADGVSFRTETTAFPVDFYANVHFGLVHDDALWMLGRVPYTGTGVGDFRLLRSTNGASWTVVNAKAPVDGPLEAGAAYRGELWAFGTMSYHSPDGLSWSEAPRAPAPALFAAVLRDRIYSRTEGGAMHSTDGASWRGENVGQLDGDFYFTAWRDRVWTLGARGVYWLASADGADLVRVVFELDATGSVLPLNTFTSLAAPPPPAGTGAVFIVGEDAQLGAWAPNAVAMRDDGVDPDRVAGDGVWTLAASFPAGRPLAYKYTIGHAGDGWAGTEEFPAVNRDYTPPWDGTRAVRLREVFADSQGDATGTFTVVTPER